MKSNNRIFTIPNLVSLSRIGITICSLFFIQNSILFLILLVIAGATDILDGFLARILHQQSGLGAKLDSIADVVLYTALALFMFVHFTQQLQLYFPLFAILTVLKCIPIILYMIRFHEFVIVHTHLNKLVGILLFMMPFLIVLSSTTLYFLLLFGVAFLTIIEEFIIAITSTSINRDYIGLCAMVNKVEK